MELKISSNNILWLLSVALGVVGLIMLVVGLIFAFAADDLEGVLKAIGRRGWRHRLRHHPALAGKLGLESDER